MVRSKRRCADERRRRRGHGRQRNADRCGRGRPRRTGAQCPCRHRGGSRGGRPRRGPRPRRRGRLPQRQCRRGPGPGPGLAGSGLGRGRPTHGTRRPDRGPGLGDRRWGRPRPGHDPPAESPPRRHRDLPRRIPGIRRPQQPRRAHPSLRCHRVGHGALADRGRPHQHRGVVGTRRPRPLRPRARARRRRGGALRVPTCLVPRGHRADVPATDGAAHRRDRGGPGRSAARPRRRAAQHPADLRADAPGRVLAHPRHRPVRGGGGGGARIAGDAQGPARAVTAGPQRRYSSSPRRSSAVRAAEKCSPLSSTEAKSSALRCWSSTTRSSMVSRATIR